MSTYVINRFSIPLPSETAALRAAPVVTLTHCIECRRIFTTQNEYASRPGDYIEEWRRAGHHPLELCPECSVSPFSSLRFSAEEAAVMQEIAREVRASIAQRQGKSHLRDSATEKAKTRDAQHDRNNARARQNWCKWKIPLMQALQEKGEMTAKMIANLMGISMDAPAHKIYVAPQNARNIGIPLVVVRVDHIETSRGPRPRRWYGLSSSETLAPLTPPRDEQSNQFMKEVKEPGGNHHPIGTQLRGQYVAKIAHHGNLPWLEKVKEEFRLRGELCAADLRAVTGFRHQRIASYVASYIPLEIARREYEVLGTDSPQGVAKTTYYKMVEVH